MRTLLRLLFVVGPAVFGIMPAGFGADYYVSPTGSSSGNGSISNPWDLATAFNHPAAVRPGDTIWLRGGTYRGHVYSKLTGTAAAPIVVRRYADERAILDSASRADPNVTMYSALTVGGAYTWFWGFEITNSEQNRRFENRQCWENQHCRSAAVDVFGPGTKLINLVIHDSGSGIGLWTPAVDAEAYGNIIFYTGWQSEERGSGHAIYAQNNTGTKRIVDNVLFSGFHSGVHFYGSSNSSLRNLHLEGNTIFNNGLLADDPNGWGILIGGSVRAENISIVRNYLYNPDSFRRSNNLSPSYGSGTTGVLLEENYSAGFKAMGSDLRVDGLRATGNVFVGSVDPVLLSQIEQLPGNSVSSLAATRGSTNRVFIRKNRYEPDKAIVTVFNWKATNEVTLDLSSFLKVGDVYDIIDVQNFLGNPVRTGEYDGKLLTVPMNSAGGTPVGNVPGSGYRTSSEFGVFQVKIRAAGNAAPRKLRAIAPALSFSFARNAGAPPPQVIALTSVSGPEIAWRAATTAAWLKLSHTQGSSPGRIQVTAEAAELAAGTYETDIRLSSEGAEPQVVPVTLRVLDSFEAPVIDSIVNSASIYPAISDALLLRIQGINLSRDVTVAPADRVLPTELGGTRVLIAGLPAFLRAVSPTHVLALPPRLPPSGDGASPLEIVVETARGSAFTTVERLSVAVGLFELPSSHGHIAATHSDGSLVAGEGTQGAASARPARAGDHISLYLTGLTSPAYRSDEPLSSPIPVEGPLEVILGGTPAVVTYAGLISPGLGQVNVLVPNLPEGLQSVILKYRGAESQSAAYLPFGR